MGQDLLHGQFLLRIVRQCDLLRALCEWRKDGVETKRSELNLEEIIIDGL